MMPLSKDIEVRSVESGRDLDQFIRFRWEVYKDNPVWVPPVFQDEKKFLSGKTLYYTHTDYRLFAAKENGKITATAACFYDRKYTAHWKNKGGFIGYFEALPDKDESVAALLGQAEDYLRSRGAETVYGPVNGYIANPSGMLADAYNESPVCLMAYNPSYYHSYWRRAGYQPSKELLALTMDLLDGSLRRKVRFIMRKAQGSSVRIRKFDKARFKEEGFRLAEIYSKTFSSHWGFSPLEKEEILEILESLKAVLDYDLILFAEHDGKTIGFIFGLPDYNPIVKKLDGELNLLNLPVFLRMKKNLRQARIVAWGASKEWRGQNVVPVLATHAYNALIDKGYTTCENSWILKENTSSQRTAYKFRSRLYKHYRIYEKKLMTL